MYVLAWYRFVCDMVSWVGRGLRCLDADLWAQAVLVPAVGELETKSATRPRFVWVPLSAASPAAPLPPRKPQRDPASQWSGVLRASIHHARPLYSVISQWRPLPRNKPAWLLGCQPSVVIPSCHHADKRTVIVTANFTG